MNQSEYESYLADLGDQTMSNVSKIKKEHRQCEAHQPLITLIMGEYRYESLPTGIGTVFVMICQVCNREWDITDYSSW